jgi:type IV secretory pathway TrbD component
MAQEKPKISARLRAPKAAAIAGIIFAILLFISIVLLLNSLPEKPLNSPTWLAERSNNLLLSFNLIPFAGIAFLWFMGVVRDHLGNKEDKFFATVFFGSGLLFLAMLFITAALTGTMILLSKTQPERFITSGIYDLGWFLSRNLMYVYANKMAGVFMISTSSLFIRTGAIPRWMALLGYLLAAIIIFRLRQIDRLGWVFLLFPLWVFLVSFYILIAHYWNKPETRSTEI